MTSGAGPQLTDVLASRLDGAETMEQSVVSILRDAITLGVFRPGERLPQDQLASLCQVSRMPVRSALRHLESEGLVEFHPHRGATVKSLTQHELQDLFAVRSLIETLAIRRVVTGATEKDLADLALLLATIDCSSGEIESHAARQAFYRRLYEVGNSPRLVNIIMALRAEVGRYAPYSLDLGSGVHHDLLDLVRDGRPDAAASWLETHLRHVAREVALRSREPEFDD